MKKKIFLLLLALGLSKNIYAEGYVVQNATVIEVTNTGGNQQNFVVHTTGGTGSCINGNVTFPLAYAADSQAHQRAYAAALLAFSTGAKVSIYNYVSNACDQVAFIDLSK